MNWKKVKKISKQIPLLSLGLLSFSTILLCQTQIEVIRDDGDGGSEKNGENIFIWTYKNSNVYHHMLKASVLVTSPILSAAATLMLLVGVNELNPYYFFPWLIVTLHGLATVQANNLLGLIKTLTLKTAEQSYWSWDGWKHVALYAMIFVFNIAECCSFYEVFLIFKLHWQYRPYFMLSLEKARRHTRDLDVRIHDDEGKMYLNSPY